MQAGDDTPAALSFEGGTGYLLAQVGARARRRWARLLVDRGLTPHQYGVLLTLAETGPIGQQQLSELIGVDPRNVVPVLDGLDSLGLLGREVHPTDRRRRVVSLTAAGQALATTLRQAGEALEQQFLRALDPAEQATLHRLLLTLRASDDTDDTTSG